MDNDAPNYYAVIPADVRYDTELSANEKLLYGEISALSNKFGYCYAQNTYFAELYAVAKRSIQRWIENLAAKGYIIVDIERDETNAVVKRTITLATKMSPPHDKNVTRGGDKNVTHNNINNNNIPLRDINNTDVLFTSLPPKGAGVGDESWEEFWNEYKPVKTKDGLVAKGSKKLAEKKYRQLLAKGVKPEDILHGLRAYLTYCQNNGRLTCGVAVFLNQERWKDDYGGAVALARQMSREERKQQEQLDIYKEFLERNK